MKAFTVLASFAALASAITITEPTINSQWDFSQSNTVEWTSVSTDQTSFKIVLVNHKDSPQSEKTLKDSVNTSDNKYTFSNVVTTPGSQYTIRLVSITGTNVGGLLAESQQFNVTKSGVAPTTTTTSPASTGTDSSSTSSPTNTKNAASTGKTFGAAGLVAMAFALLF